MKELLEVVGGGKLDRNALLEVEHLRFDFVSLARGHVQFGPLECQLVLDPTHLAQVLGQLRLTSFQLGLVCLILFKNCSVFGVHIGTGLVEIVLAQLLLFEPELELLFAFLKSGDLLDVRAQVELVHSGLDSVLLCDL